MTQPTGSALPSFPGFDVQAELGRGGMGVVYRAYDVRRGQVVALKTLKHADPAALYRFKQEFRALADVSHPNIASLYELYAEEGTWFFTMELIEGVHFLDHVRFGTDLRAGARQLAEALAALHAAGLLHRDVKPSNVLVRADGRVVLLDFGLAAEVAPGGTHQSTERHVLGTVSYMSPEQARGDPVSAASDWYSFGVLLYEAMTGRLPYAAESGAGVFRALLDPAAPPPVAPAELSPGAAQDLSDLVVGLLGRDPAARPGGAEVLRVVEAEAAEPARSSASGALIGREEQLAALHRAFDAMRTGRPVVVFVHGASGIGKTALVETFLAEATARHNAVVLSGRCYERESVPFKALDSPIDALSRFLARLVPHDVDALLPRDVAPLTRLFPVLLRVEAVASAARRSTRSAVDSEDLRRRAALALRELLARIGDRRPVVLHVDDLQWGDADSAGLFRDVMRPPDAPNVLFVGSFRRDDAEKSSFLQSVRMSDAALDRVEVPVDPLAPGETAALVEARSRGRIAPGSAALAAVVRESRGSPLFVGELVDRATARAADDLEGAAVVTLDEAIASRVARLPPEARRLLETVCVAGRPAPETLVLHAAAPIAEPAGMIRMLLAGRLLRGQQDGAVRRLDTYHDRVRESVTARLSADDLRDLHGRIAASMEAAGRPDPEQYAVHLDGSGAVHRAAEQYMRAAADAVEAQACDHAARLLSRAMEITPREAPGRAEMLRRLADALARAGRGAEAAPIFLDVAPQLPPDEAFRARVSAATAWLASGRIDEWERAVTPLLRAVGARAPRGGFRGLLRVARRVLVRRLRGYRHRPTRESDVSADLLRAIDTLSASGLGMTHIDPTRGMDMITLEASLAVRAGEPYRLSRAMAAEVGLVAASGRIPWEQARRGFDDATELAIRSGRPDAPTIVLAWRAGCTHLAGRWREARDMWTRVQEQSGSFGADHSIVARMTPYYIVRASVALGDLRRVAEVLPRALDDADRRGNLYLATNLRALAGHLLPLSADRPDSADETVRTAIERWSQSGFTLIHSNAVLSRAEVLLYRGAACDALAYLEGEWPRIRGLGFARRVQYSRLVRTLVRMKVLAAAIAASDSGRRPRLVRECADGCAAIERENAAWAGPQARLVLSALAYLRGDLPKALALLESAEQGLAAADMALHAAAARRRRGEILGGDEGCALVESATATMTAQGIRSPAAWTRMYAPGFDA